MDAAYENIMRTVADCYEREIGLFGGKSLSRVATIVVSSGSFFKRLRERKTFSVQTLERLTAWFRDPENWPNSSIPADAAAALASIGRPPLNSTATHTYVKYAECVSRDILRMPHEVCPHG